MAPDYDHLTLMEKVEVFEHAVNNTAGDDLAKLLWLKSPSSEVICSVCQHPAGWFSVSPSISYFRGSGTTEIRLMFLQFKSDVSNYCCQYSKGENKLFCSLKNYFLGLCLLLHNIDVKDKQTFRLNAFLVTLVLMFFMFTVWSLYQRILCFCTLFHSNVLKWLSCYFFCRCGLTGGPITPAHWPWCPWWATSWALVTGEGFYFLLQYFKNIGAIMNQHGHNISVVQASVQPDVRPVERQDPPHWLWGLFWGNKIVCQ